MLAPWSIEKTVYDFPKRAKNKQVAANSGRDPTIVVRLLQAGIHVCGMRKCESGHGHTHESHPDPTPFCRQKIAR